MNWLRGMARDSSLAHLILTSDSLSSIHLNLIGGIDQLADMLKFSPHKKQSEIPETSLFKDYLKNLSIWYSHQYVKCEWKY